MEQAPGTTQTGGIEPMDRQAAAGWIALIFIVTWTAIWFILGLLTGMGLSV